MGFIWALACAALSIVPLWRICERAGFHGALSLLALVPWVGFLIIAAVLSFTPWQPSRRPPVATGNVHPRLPS